ncbi:MAG: LysR family transcriptional regulator [Verrucomicrobia bacterium]|nr:LysR family transcriptional regulator [Verrucomicrobiota bacterium]
MNVHHLELFYYVAKHGGISAAARRMPYGIQQPAVSGQMGKLEEEVGAKLFERTPFRLTKAGERLLAHVGPFFENLDTLAAQLREDAEPELWIGASEFMLRDHIPAVMKRLGARHANVRLGLRAGPPAQLEIWLREGEIDVAIGPLGARPPARLRQLELARVPLVLLVGCGTEVRTADELWARKKVTTPLIGLPAETNLMRSFQRELKRRGVSWPQKIEAPSMELVASYAANGDGIGVSFAEPALSRRRRLRVLPLAGFPPLTMGLLLRREPSALVQALVEEAAAYARGIWPGWTTSA